MLSMHRTADGSVPSEARIDADLLKDLLDFVEDGVCLLDRENRVLYWNSGAEQITGYLAHEVAGRHCGEGLDLCHDCEGASLIDGECPLSKVKQDGQSRESVVYIRHRQGHRVPVRIRAHAFFGPQGEVTGLAEIFTRASAQGRTELAQAARHSGHDLLTGAQNRAYGEMRLTHELEAMTRFGLGTAWLRVDVDAIEEIRRCYGPAMVETALRMVAHTIDANLRSYDALMRWDDTSFRVMVRHAVEDRVRELARRLEVMVSTSRIEWWGEGRTVRASVAGVMAQPGDTVDLLEQRVAQALQSTHAFRCLDDTCGGHCGG